MFTLRINRLSMMIHYHLVCFRSFRQFIRGNNGSRLKFVVDSQVLGRPLGLSILRFIRARSMVVEVGF